jgi:hypothetical protein
MKVFGLPLITILFVVAIIFVVRKYGSMIPIVKSI